MALKNIIYIYLMYNVLSVNYTILVYVNKYHI